MSSPRSIPRLTSRHLKRRNAAVAAVLALGIGGALASVASADARSSEAAMNHRIYIDNSGINGTGITWECPGLTLDQSVIRSKEYAVQTNYAADGTETQRITGSLVLSVTNTANGKTIRLNVSGPATTVTAPDGSTTSHSQGRSVYVVNASNLNEPGVTVSTGETTVTYNSTGEATSFSSAGTVTDVCAELAS